MRINDTGDTDVSENNAVQAGWKLVPVEPTETMVIDGFESAPDRHFDGDKYPEEYDAMSGCQQSAFRARRCYAAMLAAAPAPPSQPAQQAGALTDAQIHAVARVCGMYVQHDNACPSKSTVEYFARNILAIAASAQ